MITLITSFIVGFIFALGLGLSGMTQPQKVVAFLDLFGHWDPSLMFVMIGAIGVHFFTYKLIRRRKSPLFSAEFQIPNKKEITPALLIGAVIFGIGWGLGGFCPGPAVTSLASFELRPLIFVGSMLVGMILFKLIDKKFKIKR
ncbi:MAG: DUF6691 family protein [Pseudobdellovibrionaceae bacterium]